MPEPRQAEDTGTMATTVTSIPDTERRATSRPLLAVLLTVVLALAVTLTWALATRTTAPTPPAAPVSSPAVPQVGDSGYGKVLNARARLVSEVCAVPMTDIVRIDGQDPTQTLVTYTASGTTATAVVSPGNGGDVVATCG
jgi:hypothetical protein